MSKKIKFDNEWDIQHLTVTNLENLFGIKFVGSEIQIDSIRIDNLAFDEKTNTFVIILYENKLSLNLINQVQRYWDLIRSILKFFAKQMDNQNAIDFENTRMMIIGSEFTKDQINNDNIDFWKITIYDDGTVSYENMKTHEIKKLNSIPSLPKKPLDAYVGNKPYIFVSYAHKDNKSVFPEIRRFQDEGYPIWYDQGLTPGQEWDEKIEEALENCSLLVVFITKNSMASDNVVDEIKFALQEKIDVVPIFLEEAEYAKGLKLRLSRKHAIFKYDSTEEDYLMDCLKAFNHYKIPKLSQELEGTSYPYGGNLNTVDDFYEKSDYFLTNELDNIANQSYICRDLIWPLAITYLMSSDNFTKNEKCINLIKTLEFTVAFNSYVLMSGLPEGIYKEQKSNIWRMAYTNLNRKDKLSKLYLTFGSWVSFHTTLTRIYKNNFKTKINKNFYIELLDKDILKTYYKIRDIKNNYFHGHILNENEYETLLNQLNLIRIHIFNHLNSSYKNYRLYYVAKKPEVEIKDRKTTFKYLMISLNGPFSMPIFTIKLSDEYLEDESLYLHDIVENKYAKIDNRLIKFKEIDKNKQDWLLYIFIGFENHKGRIQAKYRCYQRPEEDIYEDINLNEFM